LGEAEADVNYRTGFAWNLAFNVLTKVTTPLIGIVVANRLGPAIMGAYWLIVTVLVLADIFRDSAFMRVYLRETDRREEMDENYASYAIGGHFLIALVVLCLGPALANFYGHQELRGGLQLAALALVLNGFSTLPYARLVRDGRFKEAGLAESMGSILSSVAAVVWVTQGGGFWALAIMPPVRSLVFLAITYRFAPVRIRTQRSGIVKRVLGASSVIGAINILWVGFSVGDQLLISKLFGVASGGAFGAGKMMMQSADVLAKPIMQTTTVAFANRMSDPSEVARTLYKSLSAFLLAVAPVYVAVAIFAKPLVYGLLSSKFAGTVPLMPALCLYYAALYPGSFAGDALILAGKERIPLFNWLVGYALFGFAFVALNLTGNMTTIAWILAGGLVLINASSVTFAIRSFPPSVESLRSLRRALAPLVVTAAVSFGLARLPISNIGLICVGVLAVPFVHALLIGIAFNQNPVSLFRRRSLTAFWAKL